MKKFILNILLLILLTGCQSNDQVRSDTQQSSADSCANKVCNPGYICKNGECEKITRENFVDTSGTCKPECGPTASCVDGKCIENKVSQLCGGKECLSSQVCDNDVCRDKKGCELPDRACLPDRKCYKGDCLPVDSCVFNGCPSKHKCEENVCQPET